MLITTSSIMLDFLKKFTYIILPESFLTVVSFQNTQEQRSVSKMKNLNLKRRCFETNAS